MPVSHDAGSAGVSTVARIVEKGSVWPTPMGRAVAQVSLAGSGAPHATAALRAQSMSHWSLQQNGSVAQVDWQQAESLQPGVAWGSKHESVDEEHGGEQPASEVETWSE